MQSQKRNFFRACNFPKFLYNRIIDNTDKAMTGISRAGRGYQRVSGRCEDTKPTVPNYVSEPLPERERSEKQDTDLRKEPPQVG